MRQAKMAAVLAAAVLPFAAFADATVWLDELPLDGMECDWGTPRARKSVEGRTLSIGGKKYDTVCVMDIETYNAGVVSEQFLDKNGRTVLWRRFNRDDWAFDRYGKKWSEQLPENDKLIINGVTYVEWYDCITEYVL